MGRRYQKNPVLCKKLIQFYITQNGMLSEYNSFNFLLYEDNLYINTEIKNPYFINNP